MDVSLSLAALGCAVPLGQLQYCLPAIYYIRIFRVLDFLVLLPEDCAPFPSATLAISFNPE